MAVSSVVSPAIGREIVLRQGAAEDPGVADAEVEDAVVAVEGETIMVS